MKKALVLFVITIVLTSALFFLLIRLLGVNIDLPAQSICLLVALSGPTIINVKCLLRLRYLEKANSLKPSFKIAESSFASVGQNIGFDSLKQKISDKWIITFSGEDAKVIKFRDKVSFKSYGSGAWLKLSEEEHAICIDYFSLGITDVFKLRKMKKEVEQLIR